MARPLSELLDADPVMRNLGRSAGCLTQWTDKKTTGLPSCVHIRMNMRLLEILMDWFLPETLGPQSIPVGRLRKEACFGGLWERGHSKTGHRITF